MRDIAEQFAQSFGKPARFTGAENETALLSNPSRLWSELRPPETSIESVIRWTAHWVESGGRSLGKPTHFEVRDGQF